MERFWRHHPPLRDMVQAYMGIEGAPTAESGGMGGIDELVQAFGGVGGSL